MPASGLQIQVLGELAVFVDGRHVAVSGSRKTRALLAFLLLQDRPVTREHLCELLWPHPDDPRAALRWSLTKLRPILNAHADHLEADRRTVAINGLDDRVDLRRVDRIVQGSLTEIAVTDLESAAGLFHGELLEGMEIPDCHRFNEWLIARSEAARRARRLILETLTARLATTPEAALAHARARVAMDPLDEGAHVDVVRLLGALGRSAEARAQAERCRQILNTELGATPGAALREALRGLGRTAEPRAAVVVTDKASAPRVTEPAGLFGRAEECLRLEAFLEAPADRPVLYLEGEAGIGKSRLLAELGQRAVSRGQLVLAGRSWEVESIRPYGTWVEMLSELDPDLVPEDLRGDLAPLMPSLGQPAADHGGLERLTAAVQGLLRHLVRVVPGVIIMADDVHWIDQASVSLLSAVTRDPGEFRCGLACAGRPGEVVDNEPARALLRTWNRGGLLDRVAVGPLPGRDAAALARSLSADDVDGIVAACGGNPLFLIESVREGRGTAATGVDSLVADRLSILDEPTRAVARWAAVMGHAFPAARMAELVSAPLAELLDRTEILEQHGILRPHGDGWDFAHDLLRRGVLAQVSGPRRMLMHRRIAQTLAGESDPDGSLAGDLAFHAGNGGEPDLAVQAAITAGDRALRLAAFDDAWRTADRGLLQVARLERDAALERHIELLRILVLAGLGRRRRIEITDQLEEVADRARALARPAAERTARWLLSVVTEEAGDLEAASQHSLGAEAAGRAADPRTRVLALANTARCLLQLEREPERAGVLLDEAQDLADTLELSALDLHWGRGLLHTLAGDHDGARASLTEGSELARSQEDHWALFECLSRLSMIDVATGSTTDVERRHEELEALAQKLGGGSETALARTLLALARRQAGGSAEELDSALSDLRAADAKGLLAYALNEAARLDLADGRLEAALRHAEDAMAAATAVGRRHQRDRASRITARVTALITDTRERGETA